MPYWLSWLIYIGGMVATGLWGYAIGVWKGTSTEYLRSSQIMKEADELIAESLRRERELKAFLDEARAPIGRPLRNPVTGATVGYLYPIYDWTKGQYDWQSKEESDDRPGHPTQVRENQGQRSDSGT